MRMSSHLKAFCASSEWQFCLFFIKQKQTTFKRDKIKNFCLSREPKRHLEVNVRMVWCCHTSEANIYLVHQEADKRKEKVSPGVDDACVRLLLGLLSIVRQDVACALQQVVPQEQTSQRMLNATTHLHQILQNVLARLRERAHIHHSHRYQQVPEKRKRRGDVTERYAFIWDSVPAMQVDK